MDTADSLPISLVNSISPGRERRAAESARAGVAQLDSLVVRPQSQRHDPDRISETASRPSIATLATASLDAASLPRNNTHRYGAHGSELSSCRFRRWSSKWRSTSILFSLDRKGPAMHACTKIPYPTIYAAALALREIRSSSERRREVGIHPCARCSAFHLTSDRSSARNRWTTAGLTAIAR